MSTCKLSKAGIARRTALGAIGSAALLGSVQAKTGSAATTVQSKLRGSASVLDFGAVGDGATDDTAAIQAAIKATVSGGILRIPTGTYLVTGHLIANTPIRIVGDSMEGTKLVLASGASATTDVIVFSPNASAPSGFAVSDLNIFPQSGTPGRHGIHLKGGAFGFNKVLIERVRIYGLGDYAILNYGAFSSTVRDCVISGISFDLNTDNQNVLDNTIQGKFWGVYINSVAGTNMFNIRGNVIVSKLGGVKAVDCGTLTIADNQFETQGNTTDADSSMIVLTGKVRQIANTQIHGNSFNVSFNMVSSIKLKNTGLCRIYGNRFFTDFPAGGNKCIVIESASYGTIIDQNTAINSSGVLDYNISAKVWQDYDATYNPRSYIFDYGVGTCGVWKIMKWTNFPTATPMTLKGVAITGAAGQFSCSSASSRLALGQAVTISGTFGGTGAIAGYADPKTYYIVATNGSTTFTLSATPAGAGLTTTPGTPAGLTYSAIANYYGNGHFVPDTAVTALAAYRKSVDGKKVEFAGGMKVGDKTEGNNIFSLPSGFKPSSNLDSGLLDFTFFPIAAIAGSTSVPMAIRVSSAGVMSIHGATYLGATAPTHISLEGGTFQTTYRD